MVGNLFSEIPDEQCPTKVKEANERGAQSHLTFWSSCATVRLTLEGFIDSMTQSENYNLCAAHYKEHAQFM